ncbi:MAG: hypothetical protein ACD_82C00006G0002 [uncultured bacterium]|nr:MAG: hypothetical protein ACD_82C00006G0002 [uncultured bacterium]
MPSKKFDITVIPNAVIAAYMASASAAPTPVETPAQKPSDIDLLMHNIPIGPIMADIVNPRNKPFIKT